MKKISEILDNIKDKEKDIQMSYPPLSELKDGEYEALLYCNTFELKDGRKFKSDCIVKQSRNLARFEKYLIENGKIIKHG